MIGPTAKHRVIRFVPALDVPEEHEIRVSNAPAPASSVAAVTLIALCWFEFIPVHPATNVSRKRRIESLFLIRFLRLFMLAFLLFVPSEPVDQVHIHHVDVVGAVVSNQISSQKSLFVDAGRSEIDEFIGEP